MTICAACGKQRATEAEHEALDTECASHRTCARCENLCWFWNDRACVDALGGWREVLSFERARVVTLVQERNKAMADLAEVEAHVDELLQRSRLLEEEVARLRDSLKGMEDRDA